MIELILLLSFSIQLPTLNNLDDYITNDTSPCQVVEQFARAGDLQDSSLLVDILAPGARLYFTDTNGLNHMDGSAFGTLLESGSIGGTPRSVECTILKVNGNLANVQAVFKGGGVRFEQFFLLMRAEDQWRIASTTARMEH